jgi:hypothetical protein
MKALLNELGMAGGFVRPPLPELSPEDLAALRTMVPLWKTVCGDRGSPTPSL